MMGGWACAGGRARVSRRGGAALPGAGAGGCGRRGRRREPGRGAGRGRRARAALEGRIARASRLSCAHELRPMDKREARCGRAHAIASQGVLPLVPKPADAPAPGCGNRRQQGGQPSPEEEADLQVSRGRAAAGKTPAANCARAVSLPDYRQAALAWPAALPDSPTEGVTPSKPTRRIPPPCDAIDHGDRSVACPVFADATLLAAPQRRRN